MSLAIESRFGVVERIVLAALAKGLDPEIAACYCKLGCVMVCGAVERSLEILVAERLADRAPAQIGSFLKSFFKRGTNYDCEAISELLFKFDTTWGHRFRSFMEANEQVRVGISSCYAVRNSIAHGGSGSLGPRVLKQYYENALTLIAEIEAIIRQ